MSRVFSGMRPTGRLHIGHLVGALNKWVELQKGNECFFSVVDWHALTTSYKDTSDLNENIYEMVFDWLGVGVDHEKSIIFLQSQVKEHAELYLLLSMIVPMPWLERNPTLKSMIQDMSITNINLGLMGYPVLQTSDIIMYKGENVPVGEDQVPHLEMSREIVRKFNNMYKPIFPEPAAILTSTPRLLGTDGKKMSKSLNNCIYISDDPDMIKRKVWMLITDPEKIRANDPGRPEICSVFDYHKIFNPGECPDIAKRCKSGKLGCVPDKGHLSEILGSCLKEYRERRKEFSLKRDMVMEILSAGREKAVEIARETMREVREAIGLW
ncbi:MAG: tryptophan--tRNA ligase [Nitrospirota bacterium]